MAVDRYLSTAVYGSSDLTSDPDGPEVDEQQHPVAKVLEAGRLKAALAKSSPTVVDASWDEEIAVTKREEQRETLSSLELRKALAKNVVRVEQVDIAGETWQRAYDAKGEMIDARILH